MRVCAMAKARKFRGLFVGPEFPRLDALGRATFTVNGKRRKVKPVVKGNLIIFSLGKGNGKITFRGRKTKR